MSFKSEIRDSTIRNMTEKVQKKNYKQYLLKINIEKARSFDDMAIIFDFPVTALIGPNGGGKTTLLGAAACAYKSIKPSMFFSKSGRFDASMQNWKFEYEILDRGIRQNDIVRRTAKFSHYKWARDALSRDVYVFGVSRTVPATERPELRKCMSPSFNVEDDQIVNLSEDASDAVASILDKDVKDFSFVKINRTGKVQLLAGKTRNGDAYSEFHFGAGESSIIRMVALLETIPEHSLVLIEEIENGLHPVATIRIVEYLIKLSDRRNIQVIFTTHSNEALKPLPNNAIWASVNGHIYQGKLDISSLRAINGQIDSSLVVFVEDEFAKAWVEEILRSIPEVAMDAISVHVMGGDGSAVKVHKGHNENPSIHKPSICIIDGDSKQQKDETAGIYQLPGKCPESLVFYDIINKMDDVIGELTVALLRPYEEQQKVKDIINSVKNTNHDPHVIYSQIGKKLAFTAENRIRDAFINIWVRHHPEEVKNLLSAFKEKIPLGTSQVDIKKELVSY